jgi:hypothetical protein
MSIMATARLKEDGKLQFWLIKGNQLWSAWKSSDDPNASWIGWGPFLPSPGSVDGIVAGNLSDGRVQLFATSGGNPITVWKASTGEDSAWVSGAGEGWGPLL